MMDFGVHSHRRHCVLASTVSHSLALALAAAALLSSACFAQVFAAEAQRQSAPVVIANRTMVVLRGPIAGYTAHERAKGAGQRIEQALDAEAVPAVTLQDDEGGTRVLIGGKHAFMITKIDIEPDIGETTRNVAQAAAWRLEGMIRERREQEEPRFLVIAIGLAAAATLLYGGLAWSIFRVNRWASGRLSAAAEARAERLRVGGVRLLDPAVVLFLTRRLLNGLAWVLILIATTGWLTFVLERFPYTRPWGEGLAGNLLGIVRQVALAIVDATPGLVLVGVIFLIARGVVRLAAAFFDRVENGQIQVTWLDPDTSRPTRRIFSFLVWVFALALAYPSLPGAQTEAFKGLSVLLGVMVSIGGASIVGQAFSGLLLMYMRAFRRGDYVRIGDAEGTVMDLGMFGTHLRTGLGEEITLPNSSIMATTMKNYSRAVPGTGYVVDTVVTIGYSAPWRQVEAMLKEAAGRTPDVSRTPPPMVRQTALSDFYVEYRLIAYAPVESPMQRADVLHALHANIQDVFNEHGVQIMSPHYMSDPAEPQVVPKDLWYKAPARAPAVD
jgi:small-conductance mechanosensitive channel